MYARDPKQFKTYQISPFQWRTVTLTFGGGHHNKCGLEGVNPYYKCAKVKVCVASNFCVKEILVQKRNILALSDLPVTLTFRGGHSK